MRPTLPYRRRSEAHDELVRSQRQALWCFVFAAVLTAAGLVSVAAGLAISSGYLMQRTTPNPRAVGRLAASLVLLGIMIFGMAIRMFNAALYHRSGFEHRHKDR